MINLQSLFNFALWSGYASADALVTAYNKTQPKPAELSASDKAMINRGIRTLGQSYPIDQERLAGAQGATTAFYRHPETHAIIDADSVGNADVSAWEEVVATDEGWFAVSFMTSSMDADIYADLELTPWPNAQLMLRMYRLLHRAKHGTDFSLAELAQAAEQARIAAEAAKPVQEVPAELAQDDPAPAANAAEITQEAQ